MSTAVTAPAKAAWLYRSFASLNVALIPFCLFHASVINLSWIAWDSAGTAFRLVSLGWPMLQLAGFARATLAKENGEISRAWRMLAVQFVVASALTSAYFVWIILR